MPIHMDACLGYRPSAAVVKATGKPGMVFAGRGAAAMTAAGPPGYLSENYAHVRVPRPGRYARGMRQPGDNAADPPASQGPGRPGAGRPGPGSQGAGRHRDAARREAAARLAAGADAAAGQGPARGFPPAPGQPAPLYPPGPFAAWNRAPAAGGAPGGPDAAAGGPGYEPGYPALAVSDLEAPAAPRSDPAAPGSPRPGSRTAARAAARGGSRGGRPGSRGGGAAARRPARTGRPSSVVFAVGAVLLAAVGAGVFLLHAAEHQNAAAPAGHPATHAGAAASAGPTLGPFGHIASRAADPLPLTVAQLYPDSFGAGGVAFIRTTSRPTAGCASAVIGTALQAAVPASACSQVVRASYLATAEKAMGTIGVLNLSTAASAAHAGHAADASDFIAQLQGPSGPTRALGQGAGLEEAATKGHYLILIWAQFVNSASPRSPAQQAQLKTFMTQLFDATANVSLSTRMVSGTP